MHVELNTGDIIKQYSDPNELAFHLAKHILQFLLVTPVFKILGSKLRQRKKLVVKNVFHELKLLKSV